MSGLLKYRIVMTLLVVVIAAGFWFFLPSPANIFGTALIVLTGGSKIIRVRPR